MCLESLGVSTTFDKLDKSIGYDSRYWTWMISVAKVLQDKIHGVQLVSNLDYGELALNPKAYLKKRWGENSQNYKSQEGHSPLDFLNIQTAAKAFLKNGGAYRYCDQKPTEIELSDLLKAHLIIMWADWNALYNLTGQEVKGHFVVVFAERDNVFIIHDPGLKPKPGKRVDKSLLLKACSGEMLLIPKNTSPIGKIINKKDVCYCGSGVYFKKCHMKILTKEGKTRFD